MEFISWAIISKRGGGHSDAWKARHRYGLLSARGVRVIKDSNRGRQRAVVRRALWILLNLEKSSMTHLKGF